MSGIADFALDVVGLFFALTGWATMIIAPIEICVLSAINGQFVDEPLIMALIASFSVIFGFFLKWVGNGILQRHKIGLLLGCILCLLWTLAVGAAAFVQRSNVSVVLQNIPAATSFGIAAACLLFGFCQKRVLA